MATSSKKSGARQSRKRPKNLTQRKRRSSSEVRSLILEAANRVFLKQGYDRSSTRMIAEAAGIVEPMIFRHFGTKENLFEAAVIEPFARFVENYVDLRKELEFDDLASKELVRLYVPSLYGLLHHNRRLIRELLIVGFRRNWRSIHTSDPESPFGKLFRELDEFGAYQVDSGRQLGSDARLTNRIVFGTILAMAILGEWFFPDDKTRPSEEKLVEELYEFLRRATQPADLRQSANNAATKKTTRKPR